MSLITLILVLAAAAVLIVLGTLLIRSITRPVRKVKR